MRAASSSSNASTPPSLDLIGAVYGVEHEAKEALTAPSHLAAPLAALRVAHSMASSPSVDGIRAHLVVVVVGEELGRRHLHR